MDSQEKLTKRLFGERISFPWQGFCLHGNSFRPVAAIRTRRPKRSTPAFWKAPPGAVALEPGGRPGPGKPILVALPVIQPEAGPLTNLATEVSGRSFATEEAPTKGGWLIRTFRLWLVRLALCLTTGWFGGMAGPLLGARPDITTVIPIALGSALLFGAGKATAQTGFDGKAWRGSYGNPATNANVMITHPNRIDTAMANVGGVSGYWSRAPPWTLQAGDTVRGKITDTNGDTAQFYRVVTDPIGTNRVVDLFPAGHSLCVYRATDGVDSVNAKCWVDGKLDTLYGRFRRNTSFYNVSFNSANFPARSRPNLNDLLKVEAWEGSVRGSTQGLYINQFIDADTLPSFQLASGVEQEKGIERIVENDLIVTPNPSKGLCNINKPVEFYLYNVLGQEVMKGKGQRIEANKLPAGAYFLFGKDKNGVFTGPKKLIIAR